MPPCQTFVFCQPIEPTVGEELCRRFPTDNRIDLRAIALKSRETMDQRHLNPHELYKRSESRRFVLPDSQIMEDLFVFFICSSCNYTQYLYAF